MLKPIPHQQLISHRFVALRAINSRVCVGETAAVEGKMG